MSDPGVPTGDNGPRWTVDEADRVLGWHGETDADGNTNWDEMIHDAYFREREPFDALVRAVRDAARVPALQATAQRWEQARELAEAVVRNREGGLPTRQAADFAEQDLLNLLTETPDGT